MKNLIIHQLVQAFHKQFYRADVKKKMLEGIDSIFQGDKIRPITKDDYYS
jgi:hypothetical protein